MQLDCEDSFPPGHAGAAGSFETPVRTGPAAWFAAPATQVEVTIKKRRLSGSGLAPGACAAPGGAEPDAGERRPRVFMMVRDPADAPAVAPGDVAGDGADALVSAAHALPTRRRRRRSAAHQPSPVVHIVAAPLRMDSAADTDAPALTGADDLPFKWQRPAFDEYGDLRAALSRLRDLVHQAQTARAWRAAPLASPLDSAFAG